MADDPLRDLFGAPADPLADVFGTPPNPDWSTNPLTPKQPGPLLGAVEGKSPTDTAADTEHQKAVLDAASKSPGEPQDVPGYLAHGLESGLYAAGGMLGDAAESLNPVSAARDLWLQTKDIGNQIVHAANAAAKGDALEAVFGIDKESALRTAAGQAAGTPFTRFAERMQRESVALSQTPDGQKYNDLVYATADPSKSALLSPVRLVHDVLQSLPSTAAMATTVYLTRGAAVKAYSEALAAGFTKAEATAIATKAAGRVAMVYGAAGEGTVGGLQQAEQTRVQVLDAKNPTKSPVYQAMVKAGVSPADAKQYVATEAGNVAGLGAGAVDAVTNALEGPVLGRIISEGGPLISRVFKGFITEGTQEAVQGAGEQAAQNIGEKMYVDPQQKLADGVAENVISSFAVGGITGGAFTGIGGDAVNHEQQQPGDMLAPGAPKAPEEGKSYNQADAIAELGMNAEEADQFVKTGKDTRAAAAALDAHGFTPEITPEDRASAIPDTVIAAGKGLMGAALHNFDKTDLGKARLPADILDGLIARGIPEHAARGAAAGSFAEARGDPGAINPTSGAIGIGQWLGPRKEALIKRYGPKPTLDQQLDFLTYELKGGDQGGAAVLGAADEQSALNAYITKFMRPAAGAETTGDLERGMAALGRAGEKIAELTGTADETTPEGEGRGTLTVEQTMAQAGLGADVTDFKAGQRLDITQNEATTPGTVQEVYGEGEHQGVRVALDNGTTFDEIVKRAREYGARLTHPKEALDHVFGPQPSPDVAVPDAAQPKSYAGEKIDDEFTAFHPDTGTLGIPRAEMPQIKQEDRGAAVNFFEARGITHEEETVPAASLKPTQAEFAPAKVQKFLDQDAGDRAVLASSDGYVLDGHHQWVAALDKGEDVRVIRLGAPIRDLINVAHAFPSSSKSDGSTGPRVFVNEVGPDGKTTAERGRELTQEERDGLELEQHRDFVRSDTLSVLNARAQMNKNFSREEVDAFTKGVSEETGAGMGWRKSLENVDIASDPKLKVAYNKGRTAAVKELRGRGVAPIGKEAAKPDDDTGFKAEPGNPYPEKTDRHGYYNAGYRAAANRQEFSYPSSAIGKERVEPRGKPLEARAYREGYAAGEKATANNPAGESTAPEHATVGVDDRELGEIVQEFNNAQASMIEGEETLTHIFDKPKPSEIIRLQDKVRVYHKDHGWMTPAEAAAKIREWEDHAVQQGKNAQSRSYNGDKIVLSLFDLSGEWSLPWEQAGYQVFRFDIQQAFTDFEGDGQNPGDVNNFSHEFFADHFGDFEGKDIYAILAACPCTDFAVSGARHFAAKDKDGRTVASVKLVHQTLATIEHFKPAVWALENPVGRIERLGGLPPWRLSFDPNHLGETYTKKTLIWGRFNADLPIAPVDPVEGSKMHKQYGGKSLKTKNARSVTPEGFSYAFFMANNALDHQEMAVANKYDRLDSRLIGRAINAGITEQQIDEAVEDHYFQDLDDDAANAAIEQLIDERHPTAPKASDEPIADQPTEAPVNVAAAEALRAKAEPHQAEIVALGELFDADYGFINPGLKSATRIVEKLEKEGYESLDEIKDVARIGFKVEARELAADILVRFQRRFNGAAGNAKAEITDKGWRMVDGDYFDRKLIVAWPDGTKAEIQIIPDALETFRHEGGGSKLYSKWRSTEPGPEKDALLREMQDGYAKAAAGTAWESFFNELKSASGNASVAASSVSEEPGLVAKPGAGRQTLAEDQTTAQGLPETAPEATSRSSTSNSENSATATDVGSEAQVGNIPAYGTTNRVFTKERADAARALVREKLRSQVSSGFDPEFAMAGMQIAGFHIEAGARKFAALSKALADDLGVELSRLKPYLAAWYNGARDLLEGQGEDIADMDGAGEVRAALAMIPEPSLPETVNGIGDNGGIDGGITTDQGTENADRDGDAGQGSGDAPGIERGGDVGQGAVGSSDTGAGQLRTGEESGVEPRTASEPEADGSGSGERDQTGDQRGGTRSARSSRRVRDPARGSDFFARPGDLKREGSWKDAANRNLDIIELVNKLDAEGRPATPEEQGLLAKWVGWGASEIRNKLFSSVDRRSGTINVPYGSDWKATIERARDLLKGADLETALQSVQYAHFTSEGIVRGIWDGLERMGFGGGRILEPGMGVGHFFTASPTAIAEHSTYTGIELDSFSAKIAKYLLPQENIIPGDFTKQAFPDGFFDVAIGNPPFSSLKVLDDPAYKKQRFSLHNYFFAKSLDKVRPGGLLAFITSRYTMDSLDQKARAFMAERADLVGAIRLPQTAFKENAGTEVVTDVLFFQRRAPGTEKDYMQGIAGGQPWTDTQQVSVGGQKFAINEYFTRHPEMVLGKHVTRRGQFSGNDLTVEPFASKGSIEKQFAEAVARLPQDIYTEAPKAAKEAAQAKTFERDFAPASTKEGGLYVKDGKVLVVDRGSGVPVNAIFENVKPADHAWLKGYVKLRDLLKEAQRAQLDDTADWETKLGALQKEYRAFTKKNGRIKEFTAYERTTKDEEGEPQTLVYRRFKWDRLLFDIESPMVESLERITDSGEIEDGPFLKGRTLNKPSRPKIETVEDALAVTLDEIGKLDLEYIGKLIGKSQDEAVQMLGERVYQTPAGEWQTDDEYLSGDVLKKLEEAQQAAVSAPEFERNVTALIAVQPKPLSYDRITVKLGAPWIKPETVTQFAEEVLGMSGVPITYEQATAHWNVEGAKARFRRSNTDDYGTEDRSPLELLDAVLNNRSIKITRKVEKKDVVDPNATAAANEAAKKISDRFRTWLWEDSARTAEHVEIYNRSYNNLAPRKFDGSHLTLPGLSARFVPHPHVKRAVWRIIQTGNTYLAHAVGAGKTAEQIIGGQEQRRLGLIKKPMHVVPNHMLKQFSQEFLELYPAANIMVADEQAFHTGNRRRFLAQAALNDPDAIILTHSSFGKIDTSPEMRKRIVDDMVSELEHAQQDAKDEGAPRHLVSRLEKQIEQLKRRFEGRTGTGKDKLLTFDEMGVDQVLIDEAHEFRKLDFATNRTAKGIDSNGSGRALDLFIKSQWLEQRNPGRSMVMASGTPVTNTMAELYTVMRYMALKELEKDHIAAFDAWANMFGEVAPGYERNAAGGYEIVERFSKFVNVPELMKRVRNFMDVLTSAELGDLVTRPKIVNGGPQNIIVPMSEELEDYMTRTLETRLIKSREWKPSKDEPGNPDPVINIITDARLSSIDMRYVSMGRKSDPNSKLNRMIAKIAEKHHEFAGRTYTNKDGSRQPRKGSVQIVFSPVGLGEQVALTRGFDVRGWIDGELQRLGVKKSEIGWMSDAKTHTKREQLQKDVRSGKVRVILLSPKQGTGMNIQDRLKVLHFLSPPWFPSDVTQPHGRIERQGNQNGEIEIHWYATEGTYDSTGWGMVARKQKFIDDAMSGDDSVRTLDDISEINMFEMAAALAAGDDRVIRIAELGGEVERLTRLKGAHADTQRSLRSDIQTIEGFEMPRLDKRRAELQEANKARGVGFEPFTATVDGRTIEKHGEAGEALKAATQHVIDNNVTIPRSEIGTLYGKFPIFVEPTRFGDLRFQMEVGPVSFDVGERFDPKELEQMDNVGLSRRFEAAVQRIPSELQENARRIASAKDMLEKAKSKYGAPFAEESFLSEAIAERERLQAEMTAETEAKNKPQQAPAQVANRASDYTLDAKTAPAFKAELERQLKQLLPNDNVALDIVDKLDVPFPNGEVASANGKYWDRLITVAADTDNATHTFGHETLHALRAIDVITPAEWSLLVRDSWTNNPKLRDDVRERWGGLDLTEEQLKEEAVAENFGQHFDLFESAPPRWRNVINRVMMAIAAIAKAVHTLTGNKVGAERIDAVRLFERIRKGEIGSRPEGTGNLGPAYETDTREPHPGTTYSYSVSATAPAAASPDFGGESERRWKEAKKGIGSGPSVIEHASAWWNDLTGGFTRHWRNLPNDARFADASQQLRKLEAAPHAALTASVRYLRGLVGKMDADEYDLFSRKVVLDDLAWDAGEGRDLPFGFTPSTLVAARAKVDAQINLSPKLIKAVRERKEHNGRIADAMVEAGVLTRQQIKNPAYFRHMVLDYARHEAALARSPSKVKSPYWARRMGSTLDINANLLEAELDWLQKAQVDIATADTIEWIKISNHNTRDELRSRARADNKAMLDKVLASNPSARKEDGWFRSNIARGFKLVQEELIDGTITGIPPQLQAQADAIQDSRRDGDPPFAFMAWMLDTDQPGAMGAGMVLKYTGLRKQWQRKLLGDAWVDQDDVKALVKHYKPEGAVAWQPIEGRHLFTAKTVSESALDMFVTKLADTAAPGLDRAELAQALGSVRQQLVVGGDRYTMVLPEELAATLDEFGDRRGEGMVARVFGGIQSAWKRWVLINPRRYLKYNLNNQTGDLDAIIAGKPKSLTRVPEAWRMLRAASKGQASDRYTEALERGVFTSALSAQEIPDINNFSAFRHLTEGRSLRPDKLMVAGVGKLWRGLQDSTNFRESLFRLAAYLEYADEIESGKPQLKIGYGASIPRIVDAVTDPKDKAALLARDLIGDYGSISVAGSWLRRYLIPFWSWTEINTRRYWRLTANAYTTSKGRGIATGGLLGGTVAVRSAVALYSRIGLLYAVLYLWNHLLFPDDEDKLDAQQKAQLHLLLGRDSDGKVISIRTQGAFSDVLHTLGFSDAMMAFNKWRDGQGSLGSVATDMVKAPINRIGTAVTPLIMEPVEQMIGQELWPDLFNPRVIHDKWRHLFQTVNVENEYDLAAGKPSKGYGQSWTQSLVYKSDPGQMAYDEARGIAYDWLEREKGERGGTSTSARGEALRDYRLGLRYGDHDAAVKALQRYEALGGTRKTLKQSVKQAHPLGPIAKKDRKAFLASLTDEQLDTFADAEAYWRDLYMDGS